MSQTIRPQRGFSIKMFLAEGEADGLQLIDHSQWIGRGVIIPRSKLDKYAERPELEGTGIFILAGRSEQTGVERLYIGQTTKLHRRLENLEKKTFWDRLIAFSAVGDRLGRAHAEYLESMLLTLARQSNTCEVDNSASPEAPAMTESDQADADYFCDQLVMLLPAIGINAFRKAPSIEGASQYRLTGKGATAVGASIDGQFVVRAGSTASRQDSESCPGHLLDLRRSLVARGVLDEDGKLYKFAQDFAFRSPTEAATLILANASGPESWREAGKNGASRAQLVEPTPARSAEGSPLKAARIVTPAGAEATADD